MIDDDRNDGLIRPEYNIQDLSRTPNKSDWTPLRCRIFGHNYTEVRDFSRCPPGYFIPYLVCRRCDYAVDNAPTCVRDHGKWAAHKIGEMIDDE